MILLDNLFRIVECGDMVCKVAMNADHEIYAAHFPSNPITPGVCLVAMATEMLQEMRHEPLSLAEAVRIKYRNVVKPSDTPTFIFTTMEENDESLTMKVLVKDGDKVFAEMTLNYRKVTR